MKEELQIANLTVEQFIGLKIAEHEREIIKLKTQLSTLTGSVMLPPAQAKDVFKPIVDTSVTAMKPIVLKFLQENEGSFEVNEIFERLSLVEKEANRQKYKTAVSNALVWLVSNGKVIKTESEKRVMKYKAA